MRILAFDPGKANFAYAIGQDGSLETFGFVTALFTDLTTDLTGQAVRLADEFSALIKDARPDLIVAERFMARGKAPGMGAVSEFINLSLGVLVSVAAPLEVQVISAATWKNHWSHRYPSESKFEMQTCLENGTRVYPGGRRKRLTTHESDAIGIMAWAFETREGPPGILDGLRLKLKSPKGHSSSSS